MKAERREQIRALLDRDQREWSDDYPAAMIGDEDCDNEAADWTLLTFGELRGLLDADERCERASELAFQLNEGRSCLHGGYSPREGCDCLPCQVQQLMLDEDRGE